MNNGSQNRLTITTTAEKKHKILQVTQRPHIIFDALFHRQMSTKTSATTTDTAKSNKRTRLDRSLKVVYNGTAQEENANDTPSRRDGVSGATERLYRLYGASLIQQASQLLALSSDTNGGNGSGFRPLEWIRSLWKSGSGPDPFGFGGRTSNAYVVQYVKCADTPSLYLLEDESQTEPLVEEP